MGPKSLSLAYSGAGSYANGGRGGGESGGADGVDGAGAVVAGGLLEVGGAGAGAVVEGGALEVGGAVALEVGGALEVDAAVALEVGGAGAGAVVEGGARLARRVLRRSGASGRGRSGDDGGAMGRRDRASGTCMRAAGAYVVR